MASCPWLIRRLASISSSSGSAFLRSSRLRSRETMPTAFWSASISRPGPTRLTASATSLNVDDPAASADFAKRHFGSTEEMAADGFVSLAHPEAGFNLVFLRVGLPSFKPPAVAGNHADGLLVVF